MMVIYTVLSQGNFFPQIYALLSKQNSSLKVCKSVKNALKRNAKISGMFVGGKCHFWGTKTSPNGQTTPPPTCPQDCQTLFTHDNKTRPFKNIEVFEKVIPTAL